MFRCKYCLKYRHEIDSEGACEKCQEKLIDRPIHLTIEQVSVTKSVPYFRGGQVLSRSKWMEIRRKLDAYYTGVSDDEIDEYNRDIKKARAAENSKNKAVGYIYLLSTNVGYYKIGRAMNLEERLTDHRRAYPVEITVEHSIRVSDVFTCELYLLKQFREKRLQGEWFSLTPDEVAWIKSLDKATLERLANSRLEVE